MNPDGRGAPARFRELPLGAIRPGGWLREQLVLQAAGLTGHLDEFWPDVGPDSAWLGGEGEDWERGPYWLDGLVPLAHLLMDRRLQAKADRWVDAIILSQGPDGQFGPRSNEDWWPRMVALKALIQHAEATGDPRVVPFMSRYARYQLAKLPERSLVGWAQARGAENLLIVQWLYERTGEGFLPDLAALIAAQTLDWGHRLAYAPNRHRAAVFDPFTHVVNVAMGLKSPAMQYLFDRSPEHLIRTERALANLDRDHGQVTGMFSGDEWLAGPGPSHGVELCAVAELMFTLEQLVRVFGVASFADRLESIAFNALPAAITADMRAHQYLQQPNQIACSRAPRDWTYSSDEANIFGLDPHFGCCTANLHQAWPKLTSSLWMGTLDGGLAAIAYAPCTVRAKGNDGDALELAVETAYPFEETVRIDVRAGPPVRLPLLLRIPGWCTEPDLSINGVPHRLGPATDSYVRVERQFRVGDHLELTLPMSMRVLPRPLGGIGLGLGPLVLALAIGEDWRPLSTDHGFGDWEVHPTGPWNYAVERDGAGVPSAIRTERHAVATPAFALEHAPVRVHLQGHRVRQWIVEQNSAGPLPPSPLDATGPSEDILLVPYGSARLRIAEFPWVATNSSDSPLLARMHRSSREIASLDGQTVVAAKRREADDDRGGPTNAVE